MLCQSYRRNNSYLTVNRVIETNSYISDRIHAYHFGLPIVKQIFSKTAELPDIMLGWNNNTTKIAKIKKSDVLYQVTENCIYCSHDNI